MNERFTAAEIASAIGWNKRRVFAALEHCPSNGAKIVNGVSARAYNPAALPDVVIREIERIRVVHRFASAVELLNNPQRRWQPPIPLARICESDVRRADRLREALASALLLGEQVSISERARVALPHYQRVFGRAVTERQLRTLIARTIDRDRGLRDFDRSEIYLPDAPHEQANAGRGAHVQYDDLSEQFSTLRDRNALTVEDRAFVWRHIVATYFARTADGRSDADVKATLCDFALAELPTLAKNVDAMRRALLRKIDTAAKSSIDALIDRRADKSGRRNELTPSFQADIEKLARHCRHETGGRISQGYRELHNGSAATGEQFSEEFREQYPFDVRRAKSDVPASIRAAIRPILEATDARHRGPKAARLASPSIRRDWSEVYAGDSYSADDFTLNHYFIDYCDDGEYVFQGARFNITRGQTLIFCDERSLRVHGFQLTPRRNYSAATICAGINNICMPEAIGLPFRRFHFERGIWKSDAVKSAIDWARIDEAFAREGGEQLGFPKIVHTTTPRSKVIERIGGRLQDLTEGAPGYAGRNERLDAPEKITRDLDQLCRYGQRYKAEIDPREFFLTKEQFAAELERAIRAHNCEPQNGKMLDGLSPEEGWRTLHRPMAHKLLPESLRYLLSTEIAHLTVTATAGIELRRRGFPRDLVYSGHPRLGELIGQKVRVRFNAESLDTIAVCHIASDPKERRPFVVAIDPTLSALDASEDDFARVRESHRAFSKFARDVYRVIAPKFNQTVLDQNTGSEDARRVGEALIAAKREYDALVNAQERDGRKAAKIARRHNVRVDVTKLRRPERALLHAAKMDELAARISEKEAGNGNHEGDR